MQRYRISGMTTVECAKSVTQTVEALPSVERALVDLERDELSVEGAADAREIHEAVAQAGYAVTERLDPK